jgi:hypothetical protein
MDNLIANFIRGKRIDSYQKLRSLLFLQQHPELSDTCQELSERLYISAPLMEEIINDLEAVGLVESSENRCRLCDAPDVGSYLQHLVTAFEDPMARQRLLDQMGGNLSYYQATRHYDEQYLR